MRVDAVLDRVVPQKFFYNVGVTGVKPSTTQEPPRP